MFRVMANVKIGGKIPTVLGLNSKANASTLRSWGWRIFLRDFIAIVVQQQIISTVLRSYC